MWIRYGMSCESVDMARSLACPTRAASACADTLWRDSLVSTTLFVHGGGEQDPINLSTLLGQHFSRGVIDGPCNPATLTG
jgi:hypothetical protein